MPILAVFGPRVVADYRCRSGTGRLSWRSLRQSARSERLTTENPISGGDAAVVMVLEPDVLLRTTIAQFLRECGYRVIEGVVAQDVYAVLDSGARLDVVFAEVRLAGNIDGFKLAKGLRQTHAHIDVILTSGIQSAADKSEDLCEDGPIEKPYHSQDVHSRIKKLLERRRAMKKS